MTSSITAQSFLHQETWFQYEHHHVILHHAGANTLHIIMQCNTFNQIENIPDIKNVQKRLLRGSARCQNVRAQTGCQEFIKVDNGCGSPCI
jgi:hypothetical protein